MHDQVNDLLQKRMDRKDFFKHVALGVAVLSGGAALVKTLTNQGTTRPKQEMATSGYGSSVYGGAPLTKLQQQQLSPRKISL